MLSTTSSNVLNANDYQTLEVNGTQVVSTPKQNALRNTLNVAYLELKSGDVLTGKVYHTTPGYRVYFNYEIFEIE